MHSSGKHDYQLVLWHPYDHFYAFSNSPIPFQAKLIGDLQMPIANMIEKSEGVTVRRVSMDPIP